MRSFRRSPPERRCGPGASSDHNALRWLMSAPLSQTFDVPPEQAGVTLAAFLRAHLPDLSWTQVRRLVETRHVRVGGDLCLDPARRLREGSVVELSSHAAP